MRVIGICRFSYAALGGFKRMHDSIEAREAYLYGPERMELRFRHFEALTLPCIKAQTEPDFTILVVTGESLPRPYLSRLRDLTAGIPQIKIVQSPPMKHRLAMQLAIQEELGDAQDESLQFRLDDDDAVAVNFVRAIRRRARQSMRLRQNWRNMAFEFRSGYYAQLSADGILAQQVQASFLACGLAVLFRPGDPKTVMNFGHHKLHHTMPMLIEPEPAMYIRTQHDDNDSRFDLKPGALQPLAEEDRDVFRNRFNVDEAIVRSVFSGQAALRDRA